MREIETELARENSEGLFVTAFVAVIDVDSGTMTYACAGHDAPVLLRAGEFLRVDTADIGGPPLCALGDYPYAAAMLQLQPGDLLCLFTDGLTEASDGRSQLGEQGLRAVLAQADSGDLQTLAERLRDQVRRFEAGIPPADDLTLLLFRWRGPISAG
jgi:serine phosphatase RsbU (regulator of sigma subunit)